MLNSPSFCIFVNMNKGPPNSRVSFANGGDLGQQLLTKIRWLSFSSAELLWCHYETKSCKIHELIQHFVLWFLNGWFVRQIDNFQDVFCKLDLLLPFTSIVGSYCDNNFPQHLMKIYQVAYLIHQFACVILMSSLFLPILGYVVEVIGIDITGLRL